MKKLYLPILLVLAALPGLAQFENRANFYIGMSLPVFTAESGLRATEIFRGYSPVPFISAAGMYAVNKRLQFGMDLQQMYTVKPNYRLNNTSAGVVVKYNITPFNKKISPFIYGAIHASYLYVSQKQNSETKQGAPAEGEFVGVDQYYVEHPEINLSVFPVTGFHGGAGFEVNPRQRKKNVGVFMSVNYFHSFADTHPRVKELYSENDSVLSYLYATAGLRVSLLRRKSMY